MPVYLFFLPLSIIGHQILVDKEKKISISIDQYAMIWMKIQKELKNLRVEINGAFCLIK